MLSALIFLPLIGMIGVLLAPRTARALPRRIALATTAATLGLSLVLLARFDATKAGAQFVERISWIQPFHIQYFLGIDGLSLPLLILTAVLCLLALAASDDIHEGERGYYALFLFLETGLLGVFAALDFFLFFLFWEIMLLPMYFLIGIWGGKKRLYSAIKFFLYTLLGSVFILLVMVGMYFYGDTPSFDLLHLATKSQFAGKTLTALGIVLPLDKLFWVLLFVGFAIKVPVWPFHTWLPWAHVEAPTGVSVILAGVLLKMGTYGLLRISYPILPEASLWASYAVGALAVISIIYGSFCALAQSDFKRLVAYSSVAHMGYVMLGLASISYAGFLGASLQMFNHGITTGLLFLLVGMLAHRAGHRNIENADGTPAFGGLVHSMPHFSAIFALASFASLGLPGLSNFVGEAFVLFGAFSNRDLQLFTVVAAVGLVLGAAYLLWAYLRVFLGTPSHSHHYPDLTTWEWAIVTPLVALILVFGVWPTPLIRLFGPALKPVLLRLGM